MNNGTCRKVLVTVVCVLAGLGAGVSWVSAQSLAQLAKQEEARRKSVKKPAKVYTNGTLKSVPGEVIPTPPAPKPDAGEALPGTAAGQSTEEVPPAEAKPDPKTTPEYWKQRYDAALRERERNALMLDALQSRINALWTDFTARDDPAQRAVIASDRQKALDEFERRKTQQIDLDKAIADIEEEARRAGVPPGWLR